MIQHTKTRTLETNMDGGTAFTIQANAKMFKILSNSMYSNKERAIIREISCNAYDANADVGHNKPIEVHLPNSLEPYFSVKDEGPGLTPEQMENIYTQYGNSTKTDRNDQIGALGLGSKSPFSYCSSFTVSSVVNGIEYSYSCYLDENGAPKLQPFGSKEVNSPNGVTVSLPIKEQDFRTFRREAEEVYRAFDIKPNVSGDSSYSVEDYEIILSDKDGKKWDLVRPIRQGYSIRDIRVAVQGNIEYPINTSIVEQYLSDEAKKFLNTSFRLYFNIGDLDIAASREELGYDDITIKNICSKIENMVKEIKELNQEKIDNFSTAHEARMYIRELKKSLSVFSYIVFKYKGENIATSLELEEDDEVVFYKMNYRGMIKRETIDRWSKKLFYAPEDNDIFVYNDEGKKTTGVRKARSLAHKGRVIYITKKESINKLGNPEVINTSDITIRKSDTTKSYKGKYFKKFTESQYSYAQWLGSFEEANIIGLNLEEHFYYEILEGGKGSYEIYYLVKLAKELGIMEEDEGVYGVSKGHAKTKAFKALNCTPFISTIKEKIRNHKDIKKIVNMKKTVDFLEELRYLNTQVKQIIIDGLIKEGIMFELHERYIKCESLEYDEDIIQYAHRNFGKEDTEEQEDIERMLNKEYPLIGNFAWDAKRSAIIEYIEAINFMRKMSPKEIANNTTVNKINEEEAYYV